MTQNVAERIVACLEGIATGDTVGKQTETLSREDVVRWYPSGVRGLEGAPGSVIPRYRGSPKHEWRIGETTDDTEGTIAVARAILADGQVRHEQVGRELLKCSKSIHPGVKSLWEFHEAGDPARIAERHDGCGAAIRVAPVGILYTSGRLDEIVAGARAASVPTHGGVRAIAAAAATAAAISTAIDGGSSAEIIAAAELAATRVEDRRAEATAGAFVAALQAIHRDLTQRHELHAADIARRWFPGDSLTVVPLALALGAVMTSARDAILLAANIGGDSDSVASIAGGILGARFPQSIDPAWYAAVELVNQHDLGALAGALARLRR